ncbi:MAG: CHAT domain-containing protein [Ilumatobacteraceae bacterium]
MVHGDGVRNLQISFEHLEGREYQVTAALDDGETVTSAFTLPVDDVGLAEVLRDLGAALGHRPAALPEPGHDRPRRRGRARHRPTAEQFGTTLADALLAGPVGELFDRAERDSGVQLRLAFVPDQLELLKIPWEFLCHRGVFVAMQPRTPVLRELWTGDADSEPPTPGRRIRVLAIAASPEGHDPLETARELEQLALIASEHPDDVTLTTIEDCTFDQLRRALDDDHDVLHFIGHSFCDDHGEAGLVLCRDDRSPHQLSAMAFANLVGKSRTLDLVVLNSCESFRVVDGQPYASLAAKLVRVGRSAVIAMQFKISDDAAIKFSEELYHRIVVDRYGIDRAVAEARMAVMGVNEMEFATPVLYLRDGNTELFRPMTEAGPEDRPVVAPAVVERAPDHFVPSDESEFGSRPLSLQEPNLVGDDVVELQNRLVALGFEPGRVDGVYGPFTTEAIRRFQEHAQLTVVEPGACDRVTFDAIERELAASPVTEPVTGDLPRPGTVPNARKRRAMAGGVLVVGVAGILATNWPGGGSGPPSGSTTTLEASGAPTVAATSPSSPSSIGETATTGAPSTVSTVPPIGSSSTAGSTVPTSASEPVADPILVSDYVGASAQFPINSLGRRALAVPAEEIPDDARDCSPGSWTDQNGTIVGDGAVTAGLVLQATPRVGVENAAVAFTDLRVEVTDWQQPMEGFTVQCDTLPLTDAAPPIEVELILPPTPDSEPALRFRRNDGVISSEWSSEFPRQTLQAGETILIDVDVESSGCTCSWRFVVDTVISGERSALVIGDADADGAPFRTTGGWRLTPFER